MDSTLTRAKRPEPAQAEPQLERMAELLAGQRNTCRHCPHDASTHLSTSGQPHYYRRATPEEESDPSVGLYRHHRPDGPSVLVRRVVVARHAEIIATF